MQGSWVNLRAGADRNAAVIRQLVVNSPVRLLGEEAAGGFCRIAAADGREGFLSCKLLGDKPLSLAEVGIAFLPDGTPNPNYSAPRAFWLAPGLETLLAAGQHFEATMLTDDRRAKDKAQLEASPLKAVVKRFRIPEFEAMKQLLRQGVASVQDGYDPPRPWSQAKQDGSLNLEGIELPAVKASYFSDARTLLGPAVSTTSASYRFAIPYRVTVKNGPKWVPGGHYNDAFQFGAWDVGDTEAELLRPIYQHTVHSDRRISSRQTRIKNVAAAPGDADGGDGCPQQFSFGDASPQLYGKAGMPVPKNLGRRLFSIYTAAPLPTTAARISVDRTKVVRKTGMGLLVAATTTRVDLDGDGVDDLLAWEATTSSDGDDLHRPKGAYPDYRAFFANIAGEWHVLGTDQFVWGCGC